MMGSGWSVPILNIEKNSGEIIITGYKAPRDGELYAQDIKTMFPETIRTQIFAFPGTPEMQKLQQKTSARAEKR